MSCKDYCASGSTGKYARKTVDEDQPIAGPCEVEVFYKSSCTGTPDAKHRFMFNAAPRAGCTATSTAVVPMNEEEEEEDEIEGAGTGAGSGSAVSQRSTIACYNCCSGASITRTRSWTFLLSSFTSIYIMMYFSR